VRWIEWSCCFLLFCWLLQTSGLGWTFWVVSGPC
jgi:hypothetical protein